MPYSSHACPSCGRFDTKEMVEKRSDDLVTRVRKCVVCGKEFLIVFSINE